MAAPMKKRGGDPKKVAPVSKMRQELMDAQDLIDEGARCLMCDTVKKKDRFYVSTIPVMKAGITPICKECARKIACRVDKYGDDHTPTKESCIEALKWLNKPFIEAVWNTSIQESENLASGKVKSNVWMSYVKNIAMGQYNGLSFEDSDFFKERIVYEDEMSEKERVESHAGMDTYDSYLKNKADVVRLLDYDPFEKESVSEQPFLYSQLLGLLDSNGEGNDDMMRISSSISIVRGFLQVSKIDDTIAKLMSDIVNLERNSATIKSLQDSKSKITSMIKDLAAESCISLAHTKHSLKGENTWTGKIKKIKDLNLREAQVNGFDIMTCKAMRQVLDLSDAAIMQQLALDESEWSDMVAELRQVRIDLQNQLDMYKEINRILLQENLDLKDFLEENGIDSGKKLVNLKDLYSPFSSYDEGKEEMADESDTSSEQSVT